MSLLTPSLPSPVLTRHIPGLVMAVTIAVLATSLGNLPRVAALGVVNAGDYRRHYRG